MMSSVAGGCCVFVGLGTHGHRWVLTAIKGMRKWLVRSVSEGVFRKVQWPVLMLGPGLTPSQATPQK
jgi:hypothetical protein